MFFKKKQPVRTERTLWILCPVEQSLQMVTLLKGMYPRGMQMDEDEFVLLGGQLQVNFFCYSCAGEEPEAQRAAGWVKDICTRYRALSGKADAERLSEVLERLDECSGLILVQAGYEGEANPQIDQTIAGLVHDCARAVRGIVADGPDILRDANFRRLLDTQGRSDPNAQLPPKGPYSEAFWREAEDSFQRRNRSMELLRARELPVSETLPVMLPGTPRTLQQICRRAVALLAVSLYSECRLDQTDPLDHARALEFIRPILKAYKAEEVFSPKEKAYLDNPNSTQNEQIQFAWQYENLWMMEWALGLTDELPWPDQICDVPRTVQIMRAHSTMKELEQAARLRSRQELLDQADLIYRLHWCCVSARLKGCAAPQGLDEGVVMERHRALFWLAGCGEAEWDDVDLST